MKTILRDALIALILFLPAWSEAAIWSAVISNGKMRAEIDLASLMRQGNIVTAWDREIYFEPEQAQPGDFYFKSSKALIRYGCDTRTADMLMKVYYAEDGSEIKTITASYYGRPNYVIPDTDGEHKFEYACKYKKTPEKKAVVATRKKVPKEKEADKTAQPTDKKETKKAPAAKVGDTKAKLLPKDAPKAPPPRSFPIRKPSEILFRAQPVEPNKEAAQK